MLNRTYRTAFIKLRPGYSDLVRLFPGVKTRQYTAQPQGRRRAYRSIVLMGSLAVLLYGTAATYALDHDDFHDLYEKYVPFGRSVLEKLEDVQYRKGVEIRRQFYEDDEEVIPYIREHTISASSAAVVEDPLSPERFFDAQSGQVSTETKEYLPLILLPDTSDAFINEISMSINDLIQSVNASAASPATVGTVWSKIERLSSDIKPRHPKHAGLFDKEVGALKELVRKHEAVKKDYQLVNPNGSINPSLPFEMEYHNRLAREILRLERILISYVNTRSQNKETVPVLILDQPVQGIAPTTTESNDTLLKPFKHPVDKHTPLFKLAASEDFEKILEIQLQLTLASAALSHNGTIDPYVENIKEVLDSKDNKEVLIEEALEGVSVPPHVDVEAVISRVLED